MTKLNWEILRPGDKVAIIAPASHAPEEELLRGMDWLRGLGLEPVVPEDLIKPDLFFAAPLERQLQHFVDALYSDCKAIWCLRGGYGSMRLIPLIAQLDPPPEPKLFIGFSDITTLHLYLSQQWGWPVVHGRTLNQMGGDQAGLPDRLALEEMLFGKERLGVFKNLRPLNRFAQEEREIKASVTGGNLRILQSSLGTQWELDAKGKILVVEDVGERGYSVDRMLEQLFQAGILSSGPAAIVFGGFTEGLEKDGRDLADEAIKRFAERIDYPALKGIKVGHGELNFPLAFNTESVLRLGQQGELIVPYGAKF